MYVFAYKSLFYCNKTGNVDIPASYNVATLLGLVLQLTYPLADTALLAEDLSALATSLFHFLVAHP